MMRILKVCLILVLAKLVGCGGNAERGLASGEVSQARYHAGCLAAGDYKMGDVPLVPYHLLKLIEIGPAASEELVWLLEDGTLTPFIYVGRLDFQTHYFSSGTPPVRTATVGDMADYALRKLYSSDVGHRSYLVESEREKAILRWKQVID